MKKVMLAFTLFMFALAAQTSAQTTPTVAYQISVRMSDGQNTIPVPDGRGMISLLKRGNTFFNVVYTDAAGNDNRLVANTGTAPRPDCQYPIPDACYGIPNNQSIGMCICGPKDITSGPVVYNIGLLLPAVQK